MITNLEQKNYLIKADLVMSLAPEKIETGYFNPKAVTSILPHTNTEWCTVCCAGLGLVLAMTPLDAYELIAPHMAIKQRAEHGEEKYGEEDDGN